MSYISHLYSIYFAPRGSVRMAELGMQIAQQYLRPTDKLIGIIGDAGSGKSMLIKGMFPGLELTNDDEGVNVRPLPILEMLDDPLGMGINKRGFSLFATPHTYHLDIRFEQGFTQCPEIARAIMAALDKGKRVVVEHFDLIYPFLKREEGSLPVTADLMLGVGAEVIVTRPDLFGPIPQDIANIVFQSIRYRKMVHSAEDITGYILSHGRPENYKHADVKNGFVLCFRDKPVVSLESLERQVRAIIEQDVPISYHDEEHINIGDVIFRCDAPRNHVRSSGEIESFTLIKDIPYDPIRKAYLIVGLVGRKETPKIGADIDKIERIY